MKAKGTLNVVNVASHEALPSIATFTGRGQDEAAVNSTLQAVAHEIRNPLMAIGVFARKLVQTLDPSSDSVRYAKVILEETVKLEGVLSVMIDKRRVEDK